MSLSRELSVLFQRDLTRLIQQVEAFPGDDTLWARGGHLNPAGNLVLHIEGNLREYIGRQLSGVPYQREREQEFALSGLTRAGLIARIESLQNLMGTAIPALSEEQMALVYPENVLGIPLSTRSFIIHLHGHLNYHLGQIDYLRRILTGGAGVPYAGL